ncbi:MAG TPA: class I SAM-dependent methyltransferase [Methylomirabilota bacterium]|jgi:SAM-dependent methyltransferase
MSDAGAEYQGERAVLYDQVATGLDGDVAYYVDEARASGSPVLELGCGTGRILIPVAEAGIRVVGLDASADMLSVAHAKLTACGPDVRRRTQLVHGDMRSFQLSEQFTLVTIPYRAFLHNLSLEDELRTLQRACDHLTEDGRLILNAFDPSVRLLAAGRLSRPLHEGKEIRHPRTGNRVTVREDFRYDLERQLVDGAFVYEEREAGGRVVKTTHAPLTLRYVFRYEMEHLLARAGFVVETLFGDFRRGPFKAGGEQVWVARKRGV